MQTIRWVRMAGVLVGWSLAMMSAASVQAQRTVAAREVTAKEAEVREMLARQVTLQLDRVSLRQAVDALAATANVQIHYRGALLEKAPSVSLRATRLALGEALEDVLRGTGLRAVPYARDQISIEPALRGIVEQQGVITGIVTDAKTKRPINGASVSVDGATKGALTGEDGMYRLAGISAGAHILTVKHLGYGRQTRAVMVNDAQTVSADVALEASANVLNQVVVTGTVIPTELKAVPNAITVITAKDIEQRGITKIDQLFRGDVPGLFASNLGSSSDAKLDEVSMFSRGATALSTASAGTSRFQTNPIKTYVDGVELANPQYLSQIDPKSIERIEILTGPQASTIYGSNAINGVMQIFTKRGTSNTPQLTLNLLSGWVENNFSSARTPQHDYSAQLNGIEGRLSYNAGGSWNYMGPWTPAKQLARTDGFGGVRLELSTPAGRVTADMTLRRGNTQGRQRGDASQAQTDNREMGWWTNLSTVGLTQPTTRTVLGQTLGLTLSYTPISWWSHELGIGQDASNSEERYTARGYTSISDTALRLQQIHTERSSLRYATTVRMPVAALAQATVTVGADAWQNVISSMVTLPQTLTGTLTGSTAISRQPGHNTGGFLQTQLGVWDRLFLTYGLRTEWNPNFGADAQPNYAPRYGVAYTQDLGAVTAKLRASYGRSTRPPAPGLTASQTLLDYWGTLWPSVASRFLSYYPDNFIVTLANPELAPEHQQGGEGGAELYFGAHGSLVITRYNQTIDGLIAEPVVDSVRSLVPCTASSSCFFKSSDVNGYGYWYQQQYANIGSIRNQGWELQGSANTGPFTTRGTYSWTKSRVIGITSRYRAQFANQSRYRSGAPFQFLPEHTWAMGVMYSRTNVSVGLNVTGTGRIMNLGDERYLQNLDGRIRLPQNRFNVTFPPYVTFNTSYALADLTASYRFAASVEGVLQVQNLTDYYVNDIDASYASLGRQLKCGARIRL